MIKIFLQITHLLRANARWTLALAILFVAHSSHAETPEQFARKFSQFKFCFHSEVQDPKVFLATRSGDCDDFAILAADTLAKSGYATRLFAVRMKGETHVVCYIPQIKGYLDYNNRASANPIVYCENSHASVANNVAKSFNRNWVSAYEFSYRQNTKWLMSKLVYNSPNATAMLATVK